MSRFALSMLVALLACAAQAQAPSKVPVRASTAAPAASQALYVDVRTPQEYASGHIEGAINIPLEQMEARWKELLASKHKPVVLYCHSGRRSQAALDILSRKGFTRLRNGGGIDQLTASGMRTSR